MFYKYHSLLISVFISLLIVSLPVSSQIRFGLRQTQGTSWWGRAELKSLTRRIVIHEYFIDVEDDVEFETGRTGSPPPNNPNTLEITGNFYLPKQAVLTGVLIWDGDNILKGKLKSKTEARSQYEEVVDRNTSPPPRPRDPIIIEKANDARGWNNVSQEFAYMGYYRFNIYPVSWGKTRKIRIRYLCPIQFQDNAMVLPMPYSFDYPTDEFSATVQLSAAGDYSAIKGTMIDSSGKDTFVDFQFPCTFEQKSGEIAWHSENHRYFTPSLRYFVPPYRDESFMATTSFPDGNWKGNYALFWGAPPDSLLMDAGLRREIVVLWKWNFWNTFVYATDTGKTVSPYGAEVIAQAGKIRELNRTVTGDGDKVGLLLEKGSPEQNKIFPLCRKNSDSFDTLQQFLNGIDSSYLLSTISGTAPPIDIRIAQNERENFFRQGAQSFDISLKLVCSLFSEHEKVIKHIVLLTAGPVPEMPNLEDYYQNSDAILGDNVTLSAYGTSPRYPTGYWPGVPVYRIVEGHAYTSGNGTDVFGIRIPEKKERMFSVEIKSETASYDRQLSYTYDFWTDTGLSSDTISVDTVTFAGHSLTPWEKQVLWKAYDDHGTMLATFHQTPFTINTARDTALVKLFAGAENPVSDTTFASNRGARYGVVDDRYSLLALEEDALHEKIKESLVEEGVPFLTDDEIFIAEETEDEASVRQQLKTVLKRPVITIANGIVKILLPSDVKITTIRIYNLAGRLVFELPAEKLSSNKIITMNLRQVLGRGVYTLSVSSEHLKFIRKISLL